MDAPRQPVVVAEVFNNNDIVRELIGRHAPYWVTQRYFGSNAETEVGERTARQRVASASQNDTFVVPLFRGNWASDTHVRPGVEVLLHHAAFVDGARELFGVSNVRPFSVYVNLTHRLPIAQGSGHVDCPEFRGMNRSNTPQWLLAVMGMSGLFERERVNIATAVTWLYRGHDGGFEYWPDGPDAPSKVHAGDIFNTGMVGDNDRMYHRALAVGDISDGFLFGMTLDSQLENPGRDTWRITEAGKTLAAFDDESLRVSVSWKARVFADARDEQRYDDHTEDLHANEVWARIGQDLDRRGVGRPRHLARATPDVIRLLGDVYVTQPECELGDEDLDSSAPAT